MRHPKKRKIRRKIRIRKKIKSKRKMKSRMSCTRRGSTGAVFTPALSPTLALNPLPTLHLTLSLVC